MEHIMCSIKNDKCCIYTNLKNIYDKKIKLLCNRNVIV